MFINDNEYLLFPPTDIFHLISQLSLYLLMSFSLIYVFSPLLSMAMIISLDFLKNTTYALQILKTVFCSLTFFVLNVLGAEDMKMNEAGPCPDLLSTTAAPSKLCSKT